MNKKFLVASILTMTIVLAGCGSAPTPQMSASFAQCLTDKGVKMYGTERCPHCKNQKKAFGENFAKVTYIDCDKQKTACTMAKITGYPTRVDSQGNQHPGEQSPEELAKISGCSL